MDGQGSSSEVDASPNNKLKLATTVLHNKVIVGQRSKCLNFIAT